MFTVKDVIILAKNSDLRKVAVRDDDSVILQYINLAVIELYRRFNIKTKQYDIDILPTQIKYTIPDDVAYIVKAYDVNDKPISINNEDDKFGIMTDTYNSIQYVNHNDNTKLKLLCSVTPDRLVNINDKVPLPDTYIEAVLNYIGYKALGSINGNVDAENNTHYTRFIMSCKNLRTSGATHTNYREVNNFENRGFV